MLGKDMRGRGKEKRFIAQDPLGELKRYYYDAAVFSSSSIKLLVSFDGADHVIFGIDYPFGPENGNACYDEELKAIDAGFDPQEEVRSFGKTRQSFWDCVDRLRGSLRTSSPRKARVQLCGRFFLKWDRQVGPPCA